MCGRAIAHLQLPVGGSRPTLGLLAAALAELESEREVIECLLTGSAVQSGLLVLLNETAPIAERAVAVPVPLCLALSGRDAVWPAMSLGEESDRNRAAFIRAGRSETSRSQINGRHAERAGSARRSGLEGKAVAREIASAMGLRPLFIETDRSGSASKPRRRQTVSGRCSCCVN